MENLTVILRTCKNSLLDQNLQNTNPSFVRICGNDREEMIIKCFNSLLVTINNCHFPVSFHIFDDHSDNEFLDKLHVLLKQYNVNATIHNLEERGFNNSAYQQFKFAKKQEGLVYIVEDDYLHDPNALSSMVTSFLYFTRRYQDQVVIFPFDCPFRYEQGREEPTVLFHDGERYWRHVTYTTFTMFTHSSIINDHYSVFKNLALNYPKVLEDDTINKLYKKLQPQKDERILVFNPIPSLAYHLSYAEPVSIKSSQLSWKDLWN